MCNVYTSTMCWAMYLCVCLREMPAIIIICYCASLNTIGIVQICYQYISHTGSGVTKGTTSYYILCSANILIIVSICGIFAYTIVCIIMSLVLKSTEYLYVYCILSYIHANIANIEILMRIYGIAQNKATISFPLECSALICEMILRVCLTNTMIKYSKA